MIKDGYDEEKSFNRSSSTPRSFYYRKNDDVKLQSDIQTCTRLLKEDERNNKALKNRGLLYLKQARSKKDPSQMRSCLKHGIQDLGRYLETVNEFDSQDVEVMYQLGIAYDKSGDPEKAIQEYTKVLELDPAHVNAAYARGACQNRRGNFAAAIIDYQLALEKDTEQPHMMSPKRRRNIPKDSLNFQKYILQKEERVKQNLSTLSNDAGLASHFMKSPTTPKESYHEYGLSNSPQKSPSSIRRPSTDHQYFANPKTPSQSTNNGTNDFSVSFPSPTPPPQKKINRPNQELQQRLRTANVHHARGFAYRKQGDFRAAIECYDQAIELNPNHFKSWFNRAFSYDKLGQYDEAIESYQQAIRIDPNNAFTFYNLGISLDRCGRFKEAIQQFSEAINRDPTNADFYHNRGFSYRKLGLYKEAIENYTNALEINPQSFKALYNRAFSFDKLNNYEFALVDYRAALELLENQFDESNQMNEKPLIEVYNQLKEKEQELSERLR